ncbi:ferrochelatase-1, chloroplastic/mitochondrial [Rosa sericea]
MDAAVSCSGVLPQMNLSGSGVLSRSDHKFPIGRSYARSIGAVSCNKGLRIVPKKLEFLCSAASRDEERNEMVFGASHCDKKSPVGEALCVAAGVCTYGGTAVESHHSHTAEEKVGVLLLNLGGPETLDDVQPFLFNLFADPDIIRLPRVFRFLQKPLAKLISVLRAPKSKEGYASIGGGSPLRKITDEQSKCTENGFGIKGHAGECLCGNAGTGFRSLRKQFIKIKRDRITRLVVLPLYPQFSISTTGSSVRVLQKIFRNDPYLSRLPVSVINSWYQREGYIKSMADLISKELESFSEPAQVLPTGVPLSYVKDSGDPYKDQMEECIFLIMKELKARGINNEHTLAYQSRVGPVQWLKPYTDEVLVELGQKGVKSLLAVPVSFVSEHIETLEEIDMEYKELALESGIENWGRVPALGLTPSFITDLADAVIEALPLAAATSTPKTTSAVDHDPMRWAIKMFFGSFLAFILFFSPKMLMAFRNHLI